MKKSESKYFHTAIRMDEAFLELLLKKDFEYITVKEICAAAGVNRSTFYLHYETTRDLLEESLRYMQEKFRSSFQGKQSVVPEIHQCSRQELIWITPEYLTPYLNFVKKYRRLYRAAMEHPTTFGSDAIYQKMLEHLFMPILERFSVPAEERRYRIIFYVKGISGMVEQWIQDDCRDSIDQMVTMICNCIQV